MPVPTPQTPSSPISPITPTTPSPKSFPLLEGYLSTNQSWSTETTAKEPEFFTDLAKGQKPGLLWFGCSNSRTAETLPLGSPLPGSIFVHRNIANIVRQSDASSGAVLEYGVKHLGVGHVVVVGHTACGGCTAALNSPASQTSKAPTTPLQTFLNPLIELRHSLPNSNELDLDGLIRANVERGVQEVSSSAVVLENWADAKKTGEEGVFVHGWIMNLSTGLIEDLGISRGSGTGLVVGN